MIVNRQHWNERSSVPLENLLVQFTHELRMNDIDVTMAETLDFIHATSIIGVTNKVDFKQSAKTTLITSRDSLQTFDEVFDKFWSSKKFEQMQLSTIPDSQSNTNDNKVSQGIEFEQFGNINDNERNKELASDNLVINRKDLAMLSESELISVKDELDKIVRSLQYKVSRRRQTRRKGREIDFRRLIRRDALTIRPENIRYKHRKKNRSKLFVLCDISGSMAAYSRFFLHILYALDNAFDETSLAVFATNAYDVSHCVHKSDMNESIHELSSQTNEWAGGTNIGQSMNTFFDLFGERMNRRDTIVVVMSDGLDTGEPQLLNEEMARLKQSSKKVIWLNPHLAQPGYEPLSRGMKISLPYIDDFLPANSLGTLKNAVEDIMDNHSLH